MIFKHKAAARLLTVLFVLFWSSGNLRSLPATPRGGNGRFVLVIDAGHGGKDAGAIGALTKEKDINLNVALAFGRLVEKNCPDVRVIYTRKSDVFVTLQGRADIANRNKADLFISVHTNSTPAGKVGPMGAETYTLGMHRAAENLEVAKRENSVITQENNYKQTYHNFDPGKSESYIIFEFMQDRNMKQSVDLARSIQRQYVSGGRRNKGVHQAGFLVLRATSMPSVLTELGFISNPEEERFLHSREGVDILARALYEGFKAYRRLHVVVEEKGRGDSIAMPSVMEPLAEELQPAVPADLRTALTAPQSEPDITELVAKVQPVPIRPYTRRIAENLVQQRVDTPSIIHTEVPVAAVAAADTVTRESHLPELQQQELARQRATDLPVAAKEKKKIPSPPQNASVVQSESRGTAESKVISELKTIKSKQSRHEASTSPTEQKPSDQKGQRKGTKAGQNTQVSPESLPDTQEAKTETTNGKSDTPIFKVQLLVASSPLTENDRRFKGVSPVEYYRDGKWYKYTYGRTQSYAEGKLLRKQILDKFPDAFLVAFVGEKRIELMEAIHWGKQKQH